MWFGVGCGGSGARRGTRGARLTTLLTFFHSTPRPAPPPRPAASNPGHSFLSRENFDMEDMRLTMQDMLDESGAKGWRGKLGGEEQKQQVKVFQRQIDILEAMTEDERTNPRLLGRREKLRISQETGEVRGCGSMRARACNASHTEAQRKLTLFSLSPPQTVEYVNIVIKSFDHFLLMHSWLRNRDERGLSIPESMELCQVGFRG